MEALSADAVAGPLPARAATHRRHESVLQLRGLLQQLVDALALVTLADEALGGKARKLSPSERHVVLAVGEQVRLLGMQARLQLLLSQMPALPDACMALYGARRLYCSAR